MSLARKRSSDNETLSNAAPSKRSRNSQQIVNVSKPPGSNRSGKIMRVHLTNFMCHSNLVVDFSERINFLVGSNGSGKSAVMAALVIGLGCKASATSRSRSLKSFVKSGEAAADIEIWISNDGMDQYEPETYGGMISVNRHLAVNGANTIRIKNAKGNVISKKKEELDRICLYLNIQADNPVFILNQDNARSFLKDMEPKKNYALFLKATQIDDVQETLNQCKNQHKCLKYRLDCQRDEYDRYIKDKNELEKKYNDLLSLEDLRTTLENLKKEQFWVDVIEQEAVLSELSKQLNNYKEQAEKLSQLIDTVEQQRELKETIQRLEASMAEQSNDYKTQNAALSEIKKRLNQESESYQDDKSNMEKLKERERQAAEEVQQCEQYIKEKNEVSANLNSRKQENEIKVQQYRQQAAEIEAMETTSKHEYNLHNATKARYDEQKEEFERNKRSFENQKRVIQQNIDTARHQFKDKLSVYGSDVTKLIMVLEKATKAGKFSELPRGPIGRYLEVPNEIYRARIENHIGNLLRSFIVNNANDRKVMDDIVKRQFPNFQSSIITKKFNKRLYDVSKGSVNPPDGTVLMMNEIKCSDNIVMNTLIDYKNIETILLVTKRTVAERITMEQENVPRNLSKAFLINPSLEYNPSPNYRIYTTTVNPARFIQTDPQAYINQLQSELRNKEAQIQKLQSEQQGIVDQYQEVRDNINRVRSIIQKHQTNKREIVEKITELENIEYPSSNEIEILNKELQELILRKKKFNNMWVAKEALVKEKKDQVKQLEAEFNAQKTKVNSFEKKINSFKNQIDDTKVQLNKVVTSVRFNEDKLTALKTSMEEVQTKMLHENGKLEEQKAVALEKTDGVRVESKKSKADLKNTIDKIQKKLQQRSRGSENIDDIKELLDAKIQAYSTTEAMVTNLTTILDNLRESRQKRFNGLLEIKRHIGVKVSTSFTRYMRSRNYKGSLTVNHKDNVLTLSVIPRDKDIEDAVSSTKSLSGGERSYSTISFLLSLWSCVDHAFYFLDEYDVFTDQVNREMMTRLLINEATARIDRQYTFLTPQETNMAATDIIKIHKLAEPQR
ncbi:SMC6 family protein [Megaselia abdita]